MTGDGSVAGPCLSAAAGPDMGWLCMDVCVCRLLIVFTMFVEKIRVFVKLTFEILCMCVEIMCGLREKWHVSFMLFLVRGSMCSAIFALPLDECITPLFFF